MRPQEMSDQKETTFLMKLRFRGFLITAVMIQIDSVFEYLPGARHRRVDSSEKTLMLGGIGGRRRRG